MNDNRELVPSTMHSSSVISQQCYCHALLPQPSWHSDNSIKWIIHCAKFWCMELYFGVS